MKKLLLATAFIATSALSGLAADAITNLTTGTGYFALNKAWTEAQDGDVLQINSDITFNSTLNPDTRNLTIKGADGVKISIAPNSKGTIPVVINVNSTGSASIENITFAFPDESSTTNFSQQTNGTLNLTNVTIDGFKTTAANGGVRVYNSPVATTLDNLSFVNCEFPESAPYNVLTAVKESTMTLKGACDYTVCLNNQASFIIDGGISDGSKVTISFTNHTNGLPAVKGTTDLSKFTLANTSKMLAPQGEDISTLNYAKILVVNDTETGKESVGVDALGGSSGAASKLTGTSGQIIINENIDLSNGITSLAGKTVTIAGANPAVTVNIAAQYAIANAGAADTHITLKNLIVNGVLDSYTSYPVQATVAGASVDIENVTFQNITRNENYLIRANAGGVWSLDNVTFSNCSVATGNPLVNTNNDGCSISGIIKGMSLRIQDGSTVDAEGLSAESDPIALTLGGTVYHDSPVITNCEDESLFTLTNKGWSLMADNGGIKALEDKVVTGIEEVAAEAEGAAEYFDLNGMRVNAENLTPGIYVKRQGGKASKIAIR